ncbi:MAG: DUF2442 domain-containing protein [bacterium]|nr:DUF2442 domain-containing protein [bacterium]
MRESIEYYLSKGFDKSMAEYFANGRKTITSVEPQSDYILLLTFDNGEKRLYDMKPVIRKGSVFEKISDIKDFNRVYIDDTHCVAWDIDPGIDSSIVWNNKIDLCPDCCYVDSVPLSN